MYPNMVQIVNTGNILEDSAEAIVIPVNTVGVMGKGLALQAAKEWPSVVPIYRLMLQTGELKIGQVFMVTHQPRLILFPTKAHWRNPSKLEYIQQGLKSMAEEIAKLDLRSVAVPALGCGLGGLDWNTVRPLIEAALANTPADVRLYAPRK
jgi:O-acetyl-ADP-ribose deacetylase (regulator of RNase III)